ncbi:MAG: hypothetical protein GF313_16680 [Caldithrix sp.]|nr:hypothetical protein [Caldithrix sp.]
MPYMKYTILTFLAAITLFVLSTSCQLEEPGFSGTSVSQYEQNLFSRMVALGDNYIAGYQNGALVAKYQQYGFANLMALQAKNNNFKQPLLAYPGLGSESLSGIGGVLELKYIDNPETPNTINPDPVIRPVLFSDYPDFNINDPFIADSIRDYPLPYNNLAIPGILTEDILIATEKIYSISQSPLIDVVLRNPAAGNLTALQQAMVYQPSLVTLWTGTYDILAYAIFTGQGFSLDEPTPVDEFEQHFTSIVDSLLKTQAAIAVGNIPDVTLAPYFHAVPKVVIDTVTNTPLLDENNNPIPLIGLDSEDDLLMFPAKQAIAEGYGIPQGIQNGNGEPIPEEFILDAEEVTLVKQTVNGYNDAIESVCGIRDIPVVDMYDLFNTISNGGYTLAGFTFTDDFITGGFYSIDGIHPSPMGQALIANRWLDVIGSNYQASIPYVDIPQLMHELESYNTQP